MPEFKVDPVIAGMSAVEKAEAQIRVAMKSPEQLKAWLEESGRRWLVFDGLELVNALPWPGGVESFMQIIQCYRDTRAGYEKPETLTIPELKLVIQDLARKLVDLEEEERRKRGQTEWEAKPNPYK
jgi:hypothetical protein